MSLKDLIESYLTTMKGDINIVFILCYFNALMLKKTHQFTHIVPPYPSETLCFGYCLFKALLASSDWSDHRCLSQHS